MTDIPALIFEAPPTAPETFNVLLYGPPGSGKSTAAATAPGPIIWINAEGPGALGYARKAAAERGTEIGELRVSAQQRNASAVLRGVMDHVQRREEPVPATVVVDTLAKVRDALIEEFVVPGAKNTMQQFGEVAKRLGQFVTWMRDAPCNVVLIAHQEVSDEDGERIVTPLIGGALTPKIPAEVDVVGYTSRVDATDDKPAMYVAQLVEGRGRYAKDRSGGLGSWRELDLTDWLGVYREALTPDDSDLPFDATEPKPDPTPVAATTETPADAPAVESAHKPTGAQLATLVTLIAESKPKTESMESLLRGVGAGSVKLSDGWEDRLDELVMKFVTSSTQASALIRTFKKDAPADTSDFEPPQIPDDTSVMGGAHGAEHES
jgi:hypothetical protein